MSDESRERREGPLSRRSDDVDLLYGWRLGSLEERMAVIEEKLEPERLDRRYMPRPELMRDYVSRAEHFQRRDWTLRFLMAAIAAGQVVEVVLSKGH